jgi:hypothetical protein
MSRSILDAAQGYLAQGWALVPLDGKKPVLKKWTKAPVTTMGEAERWWQGSSARNVGICTGSVSGLMVLDVDLKDRGDESLAALQAEFGPLPSTLVVATGGGGEHYFFRAPKATLGNSRSLVGPGLDIRCEGGQVVAPPSIHPKTGTAYEWVVGPDEAEPAEAPGWLLSKARGEAVRVAPVAVVGGSTDARLVLRAKAYMAKMDPAVSGAGGHDKLFRVACVLVQDFGLEASTARTLLDDFNRRCDPPWSPRELDHKIDDALKAMPSEERARGWKAGALRKSSAVEALEAEMDWKPPTNDRPRQLLPSRLNLCLILEGHPEWSGRVAFDLAMGCVTLGGARAEDYELTEFANWCDQAYRLRSLNLKLVKEAFNVVARRNTLDPVVDYLRSLHWDGEERASHWLERAAGAADSPLTQAYSWKFLVQAAARALRPGCKVDTVLVLVGPQGVGKSSLFAALVGEDWFNDTDLEMHSKDRFMQLHSSWVHEVAEFASFKRAGRDRLKSFISSRSDRFRHPWGILVEEVKRRCVMVATTNETEFLADPTGSRRFWPVRTTRVDLEWVRANRDQLWAEAVALFDAEEQWWLAPDHDALRAEEAVEHQESDPWEEPISRWLESQDGPAVVSQLLEEACGVPVGQQDKRAQRRAGIVLRGYGYENKTMRLAVDGVKKPRKCWVPPGA